jgi:small GTP-binding protein
LEDKALLESYFFECQCALFIADVTSEESFKLVRKLLEKIEDYFPSNKNEENSETNGDEQIEGQNESNLNYLKKILIINKIDLSERKVSQEDISSLLNEFPTLDSLEISLKTLKGIPDLENKLLMSYEKVKDNNLPTDYIYEELEFYKNPQICSNLKAEASINIIVIGDSEVGKSCFLMRYLRNQFSDSFLTTVGIDKEARIIKVKDQIFRLILWDTAGQERFRSLPIKYYQNADGVLILYDVSNKTSLINADLWVDDYKKHVNKSKINMFLVGNKIDLKRQVAKEEAIKKANEYGMKYFEVSCKINMNITEVMSRMILQCYPNIVKSDSTKLDPKKLNKKKKSGCCGSGSSK